MSKERVVQFGARGVTDDRGSIFFLEGSGDVPFEIKRVFFIFGNTKDRGGHAHKKCKQFILCLSGSVSIITKDISGGHHSRFFLCKYSDGVYVPEGNEVVIRPLAKSGYTLLVLASEKYDREDYIMQEEK